MDSIEFQRRVTPRAFACAMLLAFAAPLAAQSPPAAPAPAAATAEAPKAEAALPAPSPLVPLAWLTGCWRGEVGLRQFQEQWMPLRGNMLVGVSQIYAEARTYSYEYLRIENRADGIYYIIATPGANPTVFKYEGTSTEDAATIFTFGNTNAATPFPRQMSYRRDSGGRLFAAMKGKVNNADREVIYPLLRVNCDTGELVSR